MARVELLGVAVDRNGSRVVREVDLVIEAGSVLGLVGPSFLEIRLCQVHPGRVVVGMDRQRGAELLARLLCPPPLQQRHAEVVSHLHASRDRLDRRGEQSQVVLPVVVAVDRAPRGDDQEQCDRDAHRSLAERGRAAGDAVPHEQAEPDRRQVQEPLGHDRADRH